MALHTKKEFATLCFTTTKLLATYAGRGKVVYSGDYVDDSLPVNQDFYKKAQDKAPKTTEPELRKPEIENFEVETETTEPVKELTKINYSPPVYKAPKAPKVISDTAKKDDSKYRHDIQKVILTNEKIKEEIEYARNRNLKVTGETIPTELVHNAFTYHFKNYTTGFLNAMEKSLTRWGKAKDFTREEMAEARGAIKKDINEAVAEAIRESGKAIKNIISVSSIKKEIGERE